MEEGGRDIISSYGMMVYLVEIISVTEVRGK
jgi:hypothetical protein